MIELTFNTAFMLYLSLTLMAVLGIWLTSHYRQRQKIVLPTPQSLFVCEFCHFAYLEDNKEKLNKCPQCGLLNKSNEYKS